MRKIGDRNILPFCHEFFDVEICMDFKICQKKKKKKKKKKECSVFERQFFFHILFLRLKYHHAAAYQRWENMLSKNCLRIIIQIMTNISISRPVGVPP